MRSTALTALLQRHHIRIFTTRDLGLLAGVPPAAAAQSLHRLAADGLVARIKRGVWIHRAAPGLHPFEAVPALSAPWPSYVSLHSALSAHGLIEEVPHVTRAVTSGLPRKYPGPLGDFQFHHLPNRLLWGFTRHRTGEAVYPLAEPEKAFLDLAYLALIPRSPLGFPRKRTARWHLDAGKALWYAARFGFPPLLHLARQELRRSR